MEIERKFLVTALPDLATAEPVAVRQGYLTRPEDPVEMRLRQKDEKLLLTLKSGEIGLVREELETVIDREQDARGPTTRAEPTAPSKVVPNGAIDRGAASGRVLTGSCAASPGTATALQAGRLADFLDSPDGRHDTRLRELVNLRCKLVIPFVVSGSRLLQGPGGAACRA